LVGVILVEPRQAIHHVYDQGEVAIFAAIDILQEFPVVALGEMFAFGCREIRRAKTRLGGSLALPVS
jgi:hypothetical protein